MPLSLPGERTESYMLARDGQHFDLFAISC